MRVIRAVVLTVFLLCAATTSASATPVEFVNESWGQHCSNVILQDHGATGGCSVWVYGNFIEFEAEIFGFHVHEDSCLSLSWLAFFNESGGGYALPSISGCFAAAACDPEDAGQSHAARATSAWPISSTETSAGVVTMTLSVCMITAVGECEGNLVMPLVESQQGEVERYAATVSGGRIGSSACELDGIWEFSDTGRIHINHTF